MSVTNNFKFISFKIVRLNYSQNQSFKNDSVTKSLEISPNFNVAYKRKESTLFVDLSIKFDGPKIPFSLQIVMNGLFELGYDISDEEIDQLANINLAAILFPFLREVVADITIKAGFAPLLLPPINFVEVYQKNQEKKNLLQE
ncbi:MAG: protein-export chaperone SecB [Proteobacteria bacterium]|nr:protein-export chaperone SecB [Pseudomonadota bacterium]MBU1697757.1 protein-export chaperone SecB [Pseudomonadota bacterium]